ncbi:MAG: MBL fold metallo-hydrolase [Candidatus Pacearchaeota archaeon]|nr:MBL fold metallo-hydrolase [Candidatus Pacearchaeota archaeon]
MAEVKVLVEGVHKQIENEKFDIGCTTVLIRSDKNIIVDPGAFVNKDRLLEALKKEGLAPEKIDAVVLTHLHLDHIVNVSLFPKSKVLLKFINGKYPGQFQRIDKGTLERFDILNEKIAEDISVIDTPGHSDDHVSVLVKTDKGKIVISGDAVGSEEWADINKKPNPEFVYSVEKYNESREKILKIADYIIPGHGKMFKVKK